MMSWASFSFAHPELLWLLALPLLLGGLLLWREITDRRPHLRIPAVAAFAPHRFAPVRVLRHIPPDSPTSYGSRLLSLRPHHSSEALPVLREEVSFRMLRQARHKTEQIMLQQLHCISESARRRPL